MAAAVFGESSTSYRTSVRSFTAAAVEQHVESRSSTRKTDGQDKELASLKRFLEERPCEGMVFRNLGLSKFGGIEELLSESKARFCYYIAKEKIFVTFPTETHEAMTKTLQSAFDNAMRDQDGENPLPWESGTNKMIHIIEDDEIVAKLIPDFTIYLPSNEAIIVVETAHSQNREAVRDKANQWYKHPGVVACIVIHIDEDPKFKTKMSPPSKPPKMEDWKAIRPPNPMGPFLLHGHHWIGKHKVSIEIFEKGEKTFEHGLFSNDMGKVDKALKRIWGKTVRVVSPGRVAVDFSLDWKIIRGKLEKSLYTTAEHRFQEWVTAFTKKRKAEEEEEGSVRKRHR